MGCERKHQPAFTAILPARNGPFWLLSSATRPSRAALESTSKKDSGIQTPASKTSSQCCIDHLSWQRLSAGLTFELPRSIQSMSGAEITSYKPNLLDGACGERPSAIAKSAALRQAPPGQREGPVLAWSRFVEQLCWRRLHGLDGDRGGSVTG
jgi:hypothetical protein